MSVYAFCRELLESGSLAAKLRSPGDLDDDVRHPPLDIRSPQRDREIALKAGSQRLPKLRELGSPRAAAICLARFAHHELMAAELFAWALLRWPDAPPGLRRGWLRVLGDEQRHCRAYLDRLEALGHELAAHDLSDYFWQHVPAISASPHGPRAFLAAMGLTLEQANLDFAPLYADAFAAVGDDATASVCRRVHEDEEMHVQLALTWLVRLSPGARQTEAYLAAVPFPLGPARAKGRRFDAQARRRAGLDPEFIEAVRGARSSTEGGRALRPAP